MDNTQGLQDTTPSQGQVDTMQTQVPETNGSNADGAAIDTNQEQTPAEGQSGEGEGLILGKFKSAEDLEKAYTELESHSKKVEMNYADFIKKAFQPESTEQKKPEPQIAEPTEDPYKDVMEQIAPRLRDEVTRMISPAIAQIETSEMVRKYGEGFVAISDKVAEKKRANPSLSLEDAFKLVSYDNLQKTSEIRGMQKASQTAAQKVKAQVESATPSGKKVMSLDQALADPSVNMADAMENLGPEFNSFKEKYREVKSRF